MRLICCLRDWVNLGAPAEFGLAVALDSVGTDTFEPFPQVFGAQFPSQFGVVGIGVKVVVNPCSPGCVTTRPRVADSPRLDYPIHP